MKSAPTPPAPSYRNHRVFRSAQRLIASRPAPKHSPRRRLKFAAVAVALLLLVVLVREIDLPSPQPDSAQTKTPGTAAKSRTIPSTPTQPAPTQDRPANVSTSSKLPVSSSATAGSDFIAGSVAVFSSVEKPAVTAARDVDTWLMSPSDGVTLRGTLSSGSQTPIPVEIFLRRKDRRVSGVVRYLSFLGERVLANAVSGEINGRNLTLKETGRVWRFTNDPGRLVQPPEEIGREFAIVLPERSGPQTLFGTWSLGRQKGTLELSPAPQW